jgi:hypothetical protein
MVELDDIGEENPQMKKSEDFHHPKIGKSCLSEDILSLSRKGDNIFNLLS